MEHSITIKITFTDSDIDDIMATALEGGITYWCSAVEVVGEYLGEYASDQISRGGELILCDDEAGEKFKLTKEKFIDGIEIYLATIGCNCFVVDGMVDSSMVDAESADGIVQCALFGEIVYG